MMSARLSGADHDDDAAYDDLAPQTPMASQSTYDTVPEASAPRSTVYNAAPSTTSDR